MKEDLLWTKTILSVYKYLERICGAIDKIVKRTAFSGANVNSQNYYYCNTFAISEKIINLSQRKITLINLKLLTESILKKMKKEDVCLLVERYIDGTKRRVLAEKENVSLRTIFRKIEHAEKTFSNFLQNMGYCASKLFEMLKEEKWIVGVYQKFSNKHDDDIVLTSGYLEKAVSM